MNTANTKPAALEDPAAARVIIPHRRIPLLVPAQEMRCARCGLIVHPATFHDDRTLLLAACCPRCDGQLIPHVTHPHGSTSGDSG